MRTTLLKWLLIVPALLFADWILMIMIGCISGLCHANDQFYCTVYCKLGIFLLSTTALYFMFLVYQEILRKK
jgi:hypothetical protein